MKSFISEMTSCAWIRSVPPAVAGGYVVDILDLLISCGLRRTHPLPQVVLTVSKHVTLEDKAGHSDDLNQ